MATSQFEVAEIYPSTLASNFPAFILDQIRISKSLV